MVCTPHYFKNPYLLAKIIEVIFIMTPGIIPGEGNTLDMFMSHPLASGQLPRALINLYIGEKKAIYSILSGIYSISVSGLCNFSFLVHILLYYTAKKLFVG